VQLDVADEVEREVFHLSYIHRTVIELRMGFEPISSVLETLILTVELLNRKKTFKKMLKAMHYKQLQRLKANESKCTPSNIH
jgi:hypothetical protein